MLSRNNPDQSGQECNGSCASWAGSGTEPRGGACLLKPHLLSDQTNFSRAGRQHCRQGGRCVWHQHWFWTVRQRCRVTIAAGRTADKSDPIPRCRGENHHQLPDNVPPFIWSKSHLLGRSGSRSRSSRRGCCWSCGSIPSRRATPASVQRLCPRW